MPAALGELAGLALLQNETHHYVVGVEAGERGAAVALYRRAGKDDDPGGRRLAQVALPAFERPLSLRFELDGPRLDVRYAAEPGQWQTLASGLDASLLSVAVAGGFIGNTFGPYAVRPAQAANDTQKPAERPAP